MRDKNHIKYKRVIAYLLFYLEIYKKPNIIRSVERKSFKWRAKNIKHT